MFPSPCGVLEFEPLLIINQAFVELQEFPSPCGVMEFELPVTIPLLDGDPEFPSPCGVMEFEPDWKLPFTSAADAGFRPLAR